MDRSGYPGFTNNPMQKDLNFKFFVDAANQPTLAPAPLNNWVASVVRTSQGVYTMTLRDTGLIVAGFFAELCLNAAGTCYAQGGPTTGFGAAYNPASPPTAVIFTLVNGAVADPPAANTNVFICGVLTIVDVAGQ
jgi:hypothetical protein